jgi:hypothetical protein
LSHHSPLKLEGIAAGPRADFELERERLMAEVLKLMADLPDGGRRSPKTLEATAFLLMLFSSRKSISGHLVSTCSSGRRHH